MDLTLWLFHRFHKPIFPSRLNLDKGTKMLSVDFNQLFSMHHKLFIFHENP